METALLCREIGRAQDATKCLCVAYKIVAGLRIRNFKTPVS